MTVLERTMGSQITALIRERILAGTYAPGSALLQDGIAAEFGVSKIPVREALVQLRAEGLVDIYAHRGFQVRPLSVPEVKEVFELRLLVEPVAVAEGARRADERDHDKARAALSELSDALAGKHLGSAGDLNSAFHLAMVVPRLQPVATEILTRLHTVARRYIAIHLRPAGRMKRAAAEHNALFKAWSEGNAKKAAALTRSHIESTRNDLEKVL